MEIRIEQMKLEIGGGHFDGDLGSLIAILEELGRRLSGRDVPGPPDPPRPEHRPEVG